jgi:hypothetical protein
MRFEQQRQLHLPQKHKATVPESTFRVEMNGLEQADNAKACDLYWKPLSWLPVLSSPVVIIARLPGAAAKNTADFHGDHATTCTAHSGATKAHDWMVSVLGPLFRTA